MTEKCTETYVTNKRVRNVGSLSIVDIPFAITIAYCNLFNE